MARLTPSPERIIRVGNLVLRPKLIVVDVFGNRRVRHTPLPIRPPSPPVPQQHQPWRELRLPSPCPMRRPPHPRPPSPPPAPPRLRSRSPLRSQSGKPPLPPPAAPSQQPRHPPTPPPPLPAAATGQPRLVPLHGSVVATELRHVGVLLPMPGDSSAYFRPRNQLIVPSSSIEVSFKAVRVKQKRTEGISKATITATEDLLEGQVPHFHELARGIPLHWGQAA